MNMFKFVKICSRNASIRYPYEIASDEKILIFDIDQCLYKSKELDHHETSKVKRIFTQLSRLDESHWDEISTTRTLFKEILYTYCNMHPKDFDTSHDSIEFSNFIKHDPELVDKLENIKLRKFCFTNGSEARASMILSLLNIEHLMECVFCTDDEDFEFLAKPSESSFAFVENYLGIKNPKNIYFFDDSDRNVQAAKLRGWNCIVVKEDIKEHLDTLCKELKLE